jgi:thiol:disulfide interchange protein
MFALLLLACSTPAPPAFDPANPPELSEVSDDTQATWLDGAAAFDTAVDAGLPTLVYFSTDWCHYCKKLDANVLQDATVQAALAGVTLVHVNPEKGTPASTLYQQFRGTYVPLLYLVTDHGHGRDRISTPDDVNPSSFVGEVHRVMKVACDRGGQDACALLRG